MMHPVIEAVANFKSSAGDLAKHLVSVEKSILKAAAKEKEAKDKQAAAEAEDHVDKESEVHPGEAGAPILPGGWVTSSRMGSALS